MPIRGMRTISHKVNDHFQAVLDNLTGSECVTLALVAGTNYHYYFYLPLTTPLNCVFNSFRLFGDASTTTAIVETFDYTTDPGGTSLISSGVVSSVALATKYRFASGGGLSVTAGFAGATNARTVARLSPIAERVVDIIPDNYIGIRAARGIHIVMNTTGTFNGHFSARFRESP